MTRSWVAAWFWAGLLGLLLVSCSTGGKLHVLVVKAGGASTCASLFNLVWKCWGYNDVGQLGDGDTENRGDMPGEMGNHLPAIGLGTDQSPLDIAIGNTHACALLYDNNTGADTVKCWGDNSSGELGLGDMENRGDAPGEMGDTLQAVDLGTDTLGDPLVPVAVAAGDYHSCALFNDGTVKCWGDNSVGQLGQGNTATMPTIGGAPGEMGDNLPPIDLGTDGNGLPLTAEAIAAGAYHTCALLRDNKLNTVVMKCWGYNGYGQLGQGDTDDRGDDPGEMGNTLQPIDLGAGRTAFGIAAGGAHVCARLDDNTVKCWGDNESGQLGQGNTATMPTIGGAPGEMGDDLPPIDVGTDRTVTTVAAGDQYTCVLLDDETAKCWGNNAYGQLGQGDTENRGDDPGEMGNDLPAIDLGRRTPVGLTTAVFHLCALFDDSRTACWGRNDVGQLGEGTTVVGTTTNRGDEPGEMGTNLPIVDIGRWSHTSY